MTSPSFHAPTYEGIEGLKGPSLVFVLEHGSGQKVLVGLGIRRDWHRLPPSIVEVLDSHGWSIQTEKDVSTILKHNGIDVDGGGAIDTIIWSHPHFDHIGDITTFSRSTKLVVGSNFKRTFLLGYPISPSSALYQHVFEGREVEEIEFSSNLQIGRFAVKYHFGDGHSTSWILRAIQAAICAD